MDLEQKRLKEELKKLKAEKGYGAYESLSFTLIPFLEPWAVVQETGELPSCINFKDIIPGYHLCPSECHIIRYNKFPSVRYVAVHSRKRLRGVRVTDTVKDGLPAKPLASPSPA